MSVENQNVGPVGPKGVDNKIIREEDIKKMLDVFQKAGTFVSLLTEENVKEADFIEVKQNFKGALSAYSSLKTVKTVKTVEAGEDGEDNEASISFVVSDLFIAQLGYGGYDGEEPRENLMRVLNGILSFCRQEKYASKGYENLFKALCLWNYLVLYFISVGLKTSWDNFFSDHDNFVDFCEAISEFKKDILNVAQNNVKEPWLKQFKALLDCDNLATGLDDVIKMIQEDLKENKEENKEIEENKLNKSTDFTLSEKFKAFADGVDDEQLEPEQGKLSKSIGIPDHQMLKKEGEKKEEKKKDIIIKEEDGGKNVIDLNKAKKNELDKSIKVTSSKEFKVFADGVAKQEELSKSMVIPGHQMLNKEEDKKEEKKEVKEEIIIEKEEEPKKDNEGEEKNSSKVKLSEETVKAILNCLENARQKIFDTDLIGVIYDKLESAEVTSEQKSEFQTIIDIDIKFKDQSAKNGKPKIDSAKLDVLPKILNYQDLNEKIPWAMSVLVGEQKKVIDTTGKGGIVFSKTEPIANSQLTNILKAAKLLIAIKAGIGLEKFEDTLGKGLNGELDCFGDGDYEKEANDDKDKSKKNKKKNKKNVNMNAGGGQQLTFTGMVNNLMTKGNQDKRRHNLNKFFASIELDSNAVKKINAILGVEEKEIEPEVKLEVKQAKEQKEYQAANKKKKKGKKKKKIKEDKNKNEMKVIKEEGNKEENKADNQEEIKEDILNISMDAAFTGESKKKVESFGVPLKYKSRLGATIENETENVPQVDKINPINKNGNDVNNINNGFLPVDHDDKDKNGNEVENKNINIQDNNNGDPLPLFSKVTNVINTEINNSFLLLNNEKHENEEEKMNNLNDNNNQNPDNNENLIKNNQNDINKNLNLNNNNNPNNNKEADHNAPPDLTPEGWINQATEQYKFTLDNELTGILKKHIIDNITKGEENKKFPSKVYYNFYKPLIKDMRDSNWTVVVGKDILEESLKKSIEKNKDESKSINNNQNLIKNNPNVNDNNDNQNANKEQLNQIKKPEMNNQNNNLNNNDIINNNQNDNKNDINNDKNLINDKKDELNVDDWTNEVIHTYNLDNTLKADKVINMLKDHVVKRLMNGQRDKKLPRKDYYDVYEIVAEALAYSNEEITEDYMKNTLAILEGYDKNDLNNNQDVKENNNGNDINNQNLNNPDENTEEKKEENASDNNDNQNANEEQLNQINKNQKSEMNNQNLNLNDNENNNDINNNNQNKNDSEVENEGLPIDQQIIKNWMLAGGCWDEGNGHNDIKQILEEYISKHTIDSPDKAEKHQSKIVDTLLSYKAVDFSAEILNLRVSLELQGQEDNQEANNINDQNLNNDNNQNQININDLNNDENNNNQIKNNLKEFSELILSKPVSAVRKPKKPILSLETGEQINDNKEEAKKQAKDAETKVTVDYQAIYDGIVNSGHFYRNMCVLEVKHPEVYEKVKQNCPDFGWWESFKVAFYRIFVFWFTNKEFEGYIYEEQKYIKESTEEKPVTSDKLLNIVNENNKDENQRIPLQKTQVLSNNQDKN